MKPLSATRLRQTWLSLTTDIIRSVNEGLKPSSQSLIGYRVSTVALYKFVTESLIPRWYKKGSMPSRNLLVLKLTEAPAGFDCCHAANLQTTLVTNIGELRSAVIASAIDCLLVAGELAGFSDALDVLECLQIQDPSIPVVFWDPKMGVSDALRLLRAGAYHCLGQGDTMATLDNIILAAVEERRRHLRRSKSASERPEAWRSFLVGDSPAMDKVVETIRLIGNRRCTVLITGESGTGKEIAARALHMASPRAGYPLVSVNCSALPDNLLEAELFGHVKGAFTGAVNTRIGRFEQANKGTIFLDEIGDMQPDLQAKLLRVLQEREIQRLGSSETIRLDVRVIAATNVDLTERVRLGRFRQDLFYRLNVVPLHMPPLAQRTSDIPALVDHFIKKICQAEGIPLRSVPQETVMRLQAARWHGNVRQLENAVEMAVAMSGSRDVLYPADFGLSKAPQPNIIPFRLSAGEDLPEAVDFNTAVAQFERSMLEKALLRTSGNKTAAAELLGIKRTTLIMKLRNFEVGGASAREVDAILTA